MDKSIDHVTQACHHCASLRVTPTVRVELSSGHQPDAFGVSFSAEVIKRSRECVTSFTVTTLLEDECHDTLHDALTHLCVQLRPLDGPPAVVRNDPAPGFKALADDSFLKRHHITIEIGDNKNPVAERAVQEVERELLHHDPLGCPVSHLALAVATANLNVRIRSRGLSAREMWTQLYQFSNQQLPLQDQDIIMRQHEQRMEPSSQ